MKPSEKLAKALADVHARGSMTFREVADRTAEGYSKPLDHSLVHRIVRGEVKPPLDTLVQLCAGYRVTLREVLERAGLI